MSSTISTRRSRRVNLPRTFLSLTLLACAGGFLFNLILAMRPAIAVEAEGQGFVAAGFGVQAEGISSFLIRTYDAKTGDLLWQDQFPMAVIQEDEAPANDPDGGRVFAGGVGVSNESIAHFPIRAYDLKTGAFLWEGQLNLVKRSDKGAASMVATKGTRTPAAKHTKGQSLSFAQTHFTLRAYDNQTGKLLWQDEFNPMENAEAGDDATLSGAFPVVWAKRLGGQLDFLVRTFDPTTGQLLWQDRFTPLWAVDGTANDDMAWTKRLL